MVGLGSVAGLVDGPRTQKYLQGCPRSAGRKLTNPVRTPQVAAVSAVIVAAVRLGHFPSLQRCRRLASGEDSAAAPITR